MTLGPNSSFHLEEIAGGTDHVDNKENESPRINDDRKNRTPRKSETGDTVKSNKSPTITSSDLFAMQEKFLKQQEERNLNQQVRQLMEARIAIEQEHYKKVQSKLEFMRLEAELKHKMKLEAITSQLEAALRLEDQEEQNYQRQRQELAKNNRKILEQQEKELRDNLKRLDDQFSKLDETFNKITRSCSPEMASTVDLYKKQFEELKVLKSSCHSSLDGLRNACGKADALCHALLKARNDHEAQASERRAKKEAEDKQAAAVAAQIQAEAARQVAAQAPPPLAPESQVPIAQLPPPPQQPQMTESRQRYNELKELLVAKQHATKQLMETPELQTLRFALKFAVNSPINLLSEKNKSTLVECFQKLHNLLSGQRITTSKGVVALSDHPEASDWAQLRIAEKLIVSLNWKVR